MAGTVYETHNNGGRPFKVAVESNQMTAFDSNSELVIATAFRRMFLGRDPNPPPNPDGGPGDIFLGNTLLAQVAPLEYVFVGDRVFRFTARAEITSYASPVGNSDVPYPYARDADDWTYLLIEGAMARDLVDHPDPYEGFYERMQLLSARDAERGVVGYDGITQFRMGAEVYNLTYQVDARQRFRRLPPGDLPVVVVRGAGNEQVLDEEAYVQLIEGAGAARGLEKINVTQVIRSVTYD